MFLMTVETMINTSFLPQIRNLRRLIIAKFEIISKPQQETIKLIDKTNENGNINCVVKQEFAFGFEDWTFQGGQHQPNI